MASCLHAEWGKTDCEFNVEITCEIQGMFYDDFFNLKLEIVSL